ncbi:nuclear poly(A) polymerase 3-like [Triticum dicoccoides]|uniref:nuclear poly(A) polymerase 3-like n=1 Tax=Triticum dicoccoides TaxID=85692 RepID=UPI00188FD89E|nr:nuclear poly(A) polymerase 3-like [Triticum dicoccoides]
MVLDRPVGRPAFRKPERRTLAPPRGTGPPPPPPIPPTPGVYLRGPPPLPPPGAILPRPIVVCLDLARMKQMDSSRSSSLMKFLEDTGVSPSEEETRRRERIILELHKIVMDWAKMVAFNQGGKPWITSGTVLTFGSYDLGAYGPESDIDAVCVGPCIASLQHHFFVVLRQMLEARPEVSDLHSIESARVPLMRFKFNGVSVDFPYAQLPVINAAEAIHANDPRLLEKVDAASWRCLSGVRVNRQIMQLVPNMKKFQLLLRCLKLWARKRGIHCHLVGFFAGIHLAVLGAYVCRRHPNATANTLLCRFFEIFSHWPWPLPVSLHDQTPLWSPDGCSLMPIVMPCYPPEFCASNVTKSTFNKIKEELWRGLSLTKDTSSVDVDWNWIFAPFPYAAKYKHFLRIVLSAPTTEELRDWVGWVKSRFRSLILKLESLNIGCDPNPLEQVDHSIGEPNAVFLWGLIMYSNTQICTTSLKKDFMRSVTNNIYGKEKCAHSDIELSVVGMPQVPKSMSDQSAYLQKLPNLPPRMLGYPPMRQGCNAVG